jgi:1-acyl-sn-glycerol-3-phosphate acyltransferase
MILPRKNKLITAWFTGLSHGKLKKSFHRMSLTTRSEVPRFEPGVPTIVVANHPSWWDALLVGELSAKVFRREYFGMFDEEQLKAYGIFRLLGGYAIEKAPGSAQPSTSEMKQFLRFTRELLQGRERLWWIFGQGDLVSPEEPVRLRRGFAAVAQQLDRVQILKLSISYDFWSESKPEIVVDILPLETLTGSASDAAGQESADGLTRRIEQELESGRQYVRDIVRRRDAGKLKALWESPAGANPVYDLYRAAKAALSGRKFKKSHAA